jgi:hypothetical protein
MRATRPDAGRSWMAADSVPFEVAESALAHSSAAVVAAYQPEQLIELGEVGAIPVWRGTGDRRGDSAASGLTMVRIAISVEAFEAIARTLPVGSVA